MDIRGRIRTWMIEAAVVAAALAVVAGLKGGWLEWVGALAVLLSFMHGQIADRHAYAAAREARAGGGPAVDCWRWSARYFLGKEIAWVVYFVTHRSWSALVGSALFLLYPAWRRWYIRRRPSESPPQSPAESEQRSSDVERGWVCPECDCWRNHTLACSQ